MSRHEVRIREVTPYTVRGNHYKVVFEEIDNSLTLTIPLTAQEAAPILALIEDHGVRRNEIYDLFSQFILNSTFSITELFIQSIENDRPRCRLTLTNPLCERVTLTCRLNDAVALILRCGGRVYVADSVMKTNGDTPISATSTPDGDLQRLEKILGKMIEQERYEDAAKLRDRINSLRISRQA